MGDVGGQSPLTDMAAGGKDAAARVARGCESPLPGSPRTANCFKTNAVQLRHRQIDCCAKKLFPDTGIFEMAYYITFE